MDGIYLLVTDPNSSVSPSPGQPVSNVTGYYHEALPDETEVAQVMERVASLYGLNCQLVGIDATHAVKRRLRLTLAEED